MKVVKVVGAVIENENGNILVTQRGYGEFKGLWEFPGGKIKENEKPKDALIREIKEELDADIIIKRYVTSVHWKYPNFYLHMKLYLCKLISKTVVLKEHLNCKWVDISKLRKINFLPADKSILNKLLSDN